jgi:hypothetical protein
MYTVLDGDRIPTLPTDTDEFLHKVFGKVSGKIWTLQNSQFFAVNRPPIHVRVYGSKSAG